MIMADQHDIDGGQVISAIPGAVTRRGPANVTGLLRSDQTGSVRMLIPATWISNVACPTMVIRICSTRASGTIGVTATWAGHGTAARSALHRQRSQRAVRLRLPGIEEAQTIEVIAGGAAVVSIV